MLTNEKKRDNARSHSDIVEVSENGHVVIGVRIVQCYHAIIDVVIGVRTTQSCPILNFALLVPIFNLLSGCIN